MTWNPEHGEGDGGSVYKEVKPDWYKQGVSPNSRRCKGRHINVDGNSRSRSTESIVDTQDASREPESECLGIV